MTTKDIPSAWTAISIVASVLLAVVVVGDRFWGSKPDSSVTSWQVAQLIKAVDNLSAKFDGLAKQKDVDALAVRIDNQGSAIVSLGNDMTGAKHDIQDLRDGATRVRADVDGLLRPVFRNSNH